MHSPPSDYNPPNNFPIHTMRSASPHAATAMEEELEDFRVQGLKELVDVDHTSYE